MVAAMGRRVVGRVSANVRASAPVIAGLDSSQRQPTAALPQAPASEKHVRWLRGGRMTITTKRIAGAALLVAVGVLFATAGVASSSTRYASATPPYKIFLSNTLLNNGWRLEMQSI